MSDIDAGGEDNIDIPYLSIDDITARIQSSTGGLQDSKLYSKSYHIAR